MVAAYNGCVEVTRFFLSQKNCNVLAVDYVGNTARDIAIGRKKSNIVTSFDAMLSVEPL